MSPRTGAHPDTFDGRLINPGHGLEGMWFLMEGALMRSDTALAPRAVDYDPAGFWISRGTGEYGGIYAFMDARGKPPQQLEWDQKMWWVHLETLVALLMGHTRLGRDGVLAVVRDGARLHLGPLSRTPVWRVVRISEPARVRCC